MVLLLRRAFGSPSGTRVGPADRGPLAFRVEGRSIQVEIPKILLMRNFAAVFGKVVVSLLHGSYLTLPSSPSKKCDMECAGVERQSWARAQHNLYHILLRSASCTPGNGGSPLYTMCHLPTLACEPEIVMVKEFGNIGPSRTQSFCMSELECVRSTWLGFEKRIQL